MLHAGATRLLHYATELYYPGVDDLEPANCGCSYCASNPKPSRARQAISAVSRQPLTRQHDPSIIKASMPMHNREIVTNSPTSGADTKRTAGEPGVQIGHSETSPPSEGADRHPSAPINRGPRLAVHRSA